VAARGGTDGRGPDADPRPREPADRIEARRGRAAGRPGPGRPDVGPAPRAYIRK
jgi:hypothetical protein